MAYFDSSFPTSPYDADRYLMDTYEFSRHHYDQFFKLFNDFNFIKERIYKLENNLVNKVDIKQAILDNGFEDVMNDLINEKLSNYQNLLRTADESMIRVKEEMKAQREKDRTLFNKLYVNFLNLLVSFDIALMPIKIKKELTDTNIVYWGFANGKWSMLDIDEETIEKFYSKIGEDTYEKVASKMTDLTKGMIDEVLNLQKQMNGKDEVEYAGDGDAVDELPF